MAKAKNSSASIFGGNTNLIDKTSDLEIKRAKLKVERYKRNFNIVVDQQTNLAKWLNASLFAINAGGILTILNNSKALNDIQVSGILFIVGIIASLLNATINQEIYDRISKPILDMIDYWSEVSVTGQKDDKKHGEIEAKMKDISKWFWVGPVAGWLSGLLFIAGAINVACNLK